MATTTKDTTAQPLREAAVRMEARRKHGPRALAARGHRVLIFSQSRVMLDILDGKLWVQRDGTEHGIATELVEAGVPKERIIRIGDNKSDVLQNCGEPVMRDTFCATTGTGSTQPAVNGACSNVDEWTYNPGAGQFMTTLRFVEGRLQSIRYGSRAR